jgi:hypothetical protein
VVRHSRHVIFSARFSRFVGEYRCPAIHAAWHRSKINGRSSNFGVRPGKSASKIGMSSGGFGSIRCREQICCKTDDIGPPCDRPGAAETSEGFEAPLSMPVPFQSLRAARRVWLRKMENVRLRIYRLGLPGPPPGPPPGCMPPFLPPFMAPFMPPAPPPVPVMSPLARI